MMTMRDAELSVEIQVDPKGETEARIESESECEEGCWVEAVARWSEVVVGAILAGRKGS